MHRIGACVHRAKLRADANRRSHHHHAACQQHARATQSNQFAEEACYPPLSQKFPPSALHPRTPQVRPVPERLYKLA
jgi:hypothetical protein